MDMYKHATLQLFPKDAVSNKNLFLVNLSVKSETNFMRTN